MASRDDESGAGGRDTSPSDTLLAQAPPARKALTPYHFAWGVPCPREHRLPSRPAATTRGTTTAPGAPGCPCWCLPTSARTTLSVCPGTRPPRGGYAMKRSGHHTGALCRAGCDVAVRVPSLLSNRKRTGACLRRGAQEKGSQHRSRMQPRITEAEREETLGPSTPDHPLNAPPPGSEGCLRSRWTVPFGGWKWLGTHARGGAPHGG